ncbi:MAG TPA: hypothetical protein VE964_09605, partial [Myxococcales bacterium]|nr:hypothetical protein [Myxococcales bacterium]
MAGTLANAHPARLSATVRTVLSAARPRRAAMVLVHGLLWLAAYAIALELRFDGAVPHRWLESSALALLVLIGARCCSFLGTGLFEGLWRYAG